MREVALAAIIAAIFPIEGLLAQNVSTGIEAGAVRMQYADSIDATAGSVSPSAWASWDRGALGGAGTFSQFTAGGWTMQGTVAGSVFTPRAGKIAGELVGFAGGSAHHDGARTSQSLGLARIHVFGNNSGVWAGAGLGAAWDGSVWRTVRQGEAGAWTRFATGDLSATFTPVAIADSIRYSDAQLALNVGGDRLDLGAIAGFRVGNRLPTLGGSAKSWGSVRATLWLASWLGIVGNAGTYPVDLTQGFPGGRFAFIGLRVSSRRERRAETRSRPLMLTPDPEVERTSRAGVRAFSVVRAESGYRTISIIVPARSRVEVIGDFTDWKPVVLTKAGSNQWAATLPLSPGAYEVNIRVDGGPWLVPPGVPSSSDEFGGAVGILVVK